MTHVVGIKIVLTSVISWILIILFLLWRNIMIRRVIWDDGVYCETCVYFRILYDGDIRSYGMCRRWSNFKKFGYHDLHFTTEDACPAYGDKMLFEALK